MQPAATHAILNPAEAASRFSLQRVAPGPGLERLVLRHWLVRWDLAGRPPFAQETLPYPCVNLVFGTHRPGVHGVGRRRFVAELRAAGWVLGVKFRPGAFRALLGRDVAAITDRALPVGEVFGAAGVRLERAVLRAGSAPARIALVEAFLRARGAAVPAEAISAGEIVDTIEADPAIARVDDLARRSGLGIRRLERMFRAHVGVSPKWVIRDFKAQVGQTPSEYAARCAASAAAAPDLARPGA